MVGRRWWARQPLQFIQKPLALGLALQVLLGSWDCGALAATLSTSGHLTETATPATFQKLRRALDQYQPQIKILSPKAGEILNDNDISLTFEVKDLPIYKDKTLGLGPHLHLVVDDRPHQSIYNAKEPIKLLDLEPGTHTVRLFASRPWDETFKNDGAFAQVTFHVFTKTDDNQPQNKLPLLTYNQPQGNYGAEPILLDFYLTNAPLHLIAQENETDGIQDWKVKATVNGQSFMLDRWQATYLKGFKPGKNWVQLEFIDQNGNRVENFGNNTARIFNYEPNGQDPLSQLTRGELTIAQSKGIVDPNYIPPTPPKAIEVPVQDDVLKPDSTKSTPTATEVVDSQAKSTTQSDKSEPEEIKPEEIKPAPTTLIPIVPIIPIPASEQQTEPTPKPSVKATEATETEPRKAFQKRLPSFMGPGKKIDVQTPVMKPVQSPVIGPSSTPETTPVDKKAIKTNKKAIETKSTTEPARTTPIETKLSAPEPIREKSTDNKSEEPKLDASKKGNWFDRFRQPEESSPTPKITEQKSVDNSQPTEALQPLEISKPVPEKKSISTENIPTENKSESQSIENSSQKKPAIETRQPFNLFSPGKKVELATPTKPTTTTPEAIPLSAQPATIPIKGTDKNIIDVPPSIGSPEPIRDKPAEKKLEEANLEAPKKGNWFDRFRQPTESSLPPQIIEQKSVTDSQPVEAAKQTISETKSISIRDKVEPQPIENSSQKKPTIETKQPSNRFGPGKKVEMVTPIKAVTTPEAVKSPAQPVAIPAKINNLEKLAEEADPKQKTTIDKSDEKSGNWLDRFRKPAAEKPEVKPAKSKTTLIDLDEEKSPEIQQSIPKNIQVSPGKKVEVKTPVIPEVKAPVIPEVKTPTAPEIKSNRSNSPAIPSKPIPVTETPITTNETNPAEKSERTSENWLNRFKQNVQEKITSSSSGEKESKIRSDGNQPISNPKETNFPKNTIQPIIQSTTKPIVQTIAKPVIPNLKEIDLPKNTIQPTIQPTTKPLAKPTTLTTIAKPESIQSTTIKPIPTNVASTIVKPVVKPVTTPITQQAKPIPQTSIPSPSPATKPIVKQQPIVKPIVKPANNPIPTKLETSKLETSKLEISEPDKIPDSKILESTPESNSDSMQKLIDRLKNTPTPPTNQIKSTIPTEPNLTGEELINQLKTKFKTAKNEPEPMELENRNSVNNKSTVPSNQSP